MAAIPTKILLFILMGLGGVIIFCGVSCIGVGAKVMTQYDTGKTMKLVAKGVGGAVCGLGVFICLIGVVAILSGLSGGSNAVKQYTIFVSIMIVIQLAVLIALAVLWKSEKGRILEAVKEGTGSDNEEKRQDSVGVQKVFECCGGYATTEWQERNKYCCIDKVPCSEDKQFTKSCKDVLDNGGHAAKFIGIGIFFLVVQLASLVLAVILVVATKPPTQA